MAYSIEQQPNQITASNAPMVYVVKESDGAITGASKFRYIIQVQISTSDPSDASTFSTIAKIKLFKNSASVAIADISKIINSYIETQEASVIENPSGTFTTQTGANSSIHAVGVKDTARPFSSNQSQIIGVRISAGYEKATSQTTSPVETLDPTGTYLSNVSYVINATTPFAANGTQEGGLDVATSQRTLYAFLPRTSAKKFLTNAPTIQFVRGGDASADNEDELTLAFLNKGLITSDIDSIVRVYVSYHQADGTTIGTHWFVNEIAGGGIATADDVKNSLLYIGCGTKNLQTQADDTDARPSANAGWVYYRVWGAAVDGTQETQYYYFYKYGGGTNVDDRHQSCTRFDNIRLAWLNRLGAWDYMNFRGKSTESVDIEKQYREAVVGTWDTSTFSYENYDAGKKALYADAKRKLTINSDWLNPDEGAWLEELFTSTNVQILARGSMVYPVIVTNKTYTKKTSVNNKIKIQYTINLEYSNKIRTNN
jgi:hypothetical protein